MIGIVQDTATRSGFSHVDPPPSQTFLMSAGDATEADLTTSITWTTSIVLDLLLLIAAVVFSFAAIVLTIWPLTFGRSNLLTVSNGGPKAHGADVPRAGGNGNA